MSPAENVLCPHGLSFEASDLKLGVEVHLEFRHLPKFFEVDISNGLGVMAAGDIAGDIFTTNLSM